MMWLKLLALLPLLGKVYADIPDDWQSQIDGYNAFYSATDINKYMVSKCLFTSALL